MPEFTEPRVAQLSAESLAKVQQIERKLGQDVYVVAYEQTVVPAALSPEQLAELKRLEGEVGYCLVAYERNVK